MKFSTKFFFHKISIPLILIGLITRSAFAQTNKPLQTNSDEVVLNNNYLLASLTEINHNGLGRQVSLTNSNSTSNKWGQVNIPPSLLNDDFKPWESEKHFWAGVTEMAILEFIPWALAKWFRTWEDPAKNWANVSSDTWWRNISSGWEYDGDNFTTNNFAHPYHGALFFNAGRTNGYNFWESTAFSLSGSAMWEFFGETYRPHSTIGSTPELAELISEKLLTDCLLW